MKKQERNMKMILKKLKQSVSPIEMLDIWAERWMEKLRQLLRSALPRVWRLVLTSNQDAYANERIGLHFQREG